jgi:hypothetical protein
VLRAFEGEYRARFGADAGVTLTYHPMFFVARRKDEGLAESRHPGENRGPEGGDIPNDRDK